MITMMTLIFSSMTAAANSLTVFDSQAGFYDALHARLAVDTHTNQAYVKVFLVDESFYNACRGNQGVMRGISNSECRIKTQTVIVPGLAYDTADKTFTYEGNQVGNSDLRMDVYHKDVDNGIRINTKKYMRVTLQAP
jgi:hypothetical protein